jgi:hypothetical protein
VSSDIELLSYAPALKERHGIIASYGYGVACRFISVIAREEIMKTVMLAAFAILICAAAANIANAQGAPGPGAKIYDFPPVGGTLPREMKGFYLRRAPMADCPKGIYWVRTGRSNTDNANHRGRTTTCAQ